MGSIYNHLRRYDHFKQLLEGVAPTLSEVIVDQRSSATTADAFQRIATSIETWQVGRRGVHQPQYESLIEHITSRLSREDRGRILIVELGAGKGLFGRLLKERLSSFAQSIVNVAIDVQPISIRGMDCIRITADIKSCDLHQIITDIIPDTKDARVVIIAKHFCGSATDAAISCISALPATAHYTIEQVVVAPCCHGSVQYDTYANHRYLRGVGINSYLDLEALKKILVLSKNRTALGPKRIMSECPYELYRYGRLSRRLIEEGRIKLLQEGLNLPYSNMIEYVPSATTPDNLLLLLHRTPDTPRIDTNHTSGTHLTMHVDVSSAKQSPPYRLVQYLLEKKMDGVGTINVNWVDQAQRPSVLSLALISCMC